MRYDFKTVIGKTIIGGNTNSIITGVSLNVWDATISIHIQGGEPILIDDLNNLKKYKLGD